MDTIGVRLRTLIREIDITATKLSQDTGHGKNYISCIMRGTNNDPGQGLYDYLEVRYNVNPRWLKYGEGDMFLEGGMQKRDYSGARLLMEINALPPEDQRIIKVMVEALKLRATAAKQKEQESEATI